MNRKWPWGVIFVGGVLVVLAILVFWVQTQLRSSTSSYGTYEMNSDLAVRNTSYDSAGMKGDTFGIAYDSYQAPSVPQTSGGESVMPEDRLIIKTASLSVLVDDVAAAVQSLAEYAQKNGGFEVVRNVYKYGAGLNGSITIRVPAKLFDASLGEINKLGEVQSQQINGEDVTEEFVDVEAQLRNLQATEQQFLSIMNKAVKIEDVLAVQRELTNVRSQIERLEGRKKYLTESARLSTITVNFSTDPDQLPVVEDTNKWKPLVVAKDALRNLVELGKSVANFAIRFVVFLPVWVVLGAVILVARNKVKKSRMQGK